VGLLVAQSVPPSARAQAAEDARHSDAVPGVPPGYQAAEVDEEVAEIRAQRVRELERQVDAERYYRTASPERSLRARYGGATWNLYEPYE
jgi:hypothetical protein